MTARQGWKINSDRFGGVQIGREEMLAGRRGGVRHAIDSGLAAAEWYHTEVARKDIKALMQRSNQSAIRDTIVLYGGMIVFATLGWQLWPSLWSVPFWLAYGVLYGSASDSRWHECSHGTAFRTPWLNTWVYHIASFMIVRHPVTWRWSHARHHTDTCIVGRDPEIAVMRPPVFARLIANFAGLLDGWNGWGRMLLNASGRIAAGYREMWPALVRQLAYDDYFITRTLPATARPYRADLHPARAEGLPA